MSNAEALEQESNVGKPGISAPPLQLKKQENPKQGFTSTSPGTQAQMPFQLKSKMEHAFGRDFSQVKIYQNSDQAQALQAKAFTKGQEVYFAPGAYQPNSKSGQELLAHELSHVDQQEQQNVPTTHEKQGQPINADSKLERDADQKAALAVQGKTIDTPSNSSKQGSVTNPVVQGMFTDPMASMHEVFSGSISSMQEDSSYFTDKIGQGTDFAKDAANKATGNLSLITDITAFFNKGISAIEAILKDPIAFLENLFGAIKDGSLMFFGNVTKHLVAGLTDYIFKALGSTGISIPQSVSLSAVLSMAEQILTKVWNLIKAKLLKMIGYTLGMSQQVTQVLKQMIDIAPTALMAVFKAVVKEAKKI